MVDRLRHFGSPESELFFRVTGSSNIAGTLRADAIIQKSGKLKVPRSVAVTQAQNASAENLFILAGRSLDVADGEKMRDADSLSRRHLVALLFYLYAVHSRLQSSSGCPNHRVLRDDWVIRLHNLTTGRLKLQHPEEICAAI